MTMESVLARVNRIASSQLTSDLRDEVQALQFQIAGIQALRSELATSDGTIACQVVVGRLDAIIPPSTQA